MTMARQLLLLENFANNICALLAEAGQRAGFQTQEVDTVDECLEAVRRSPPDAVLMVTNNIREKCAFDIAEAIRSAHPQCGFIFLAGSETDRREGFLAAGYMFHVREIPLPISVLIGAIREAMDSPMETFVIPEAQPLS
jgi:DNA-binding response OmpR family regulator